LSKGRANTGFVGDLTYEEFANDQVTHLAVWKCVEVLGEASSRIMKLDPSFPDRHPELQLKKAYEMRNRLTHGYSNVDLVILWGTVENFVPAMVEAARVILTDVSKP
jgi:uncharacterized protein with HEPN domain